MSLCLIAIFKNEGHILTEFVNHYLRQGVDKLLFINNGSDDDYLNKLQPYIDKNNVELITDNRKHVHIECYNIYFLDKCKKYDWVIVCDLDELIYARNGFNTIKDYLITLDDSISSVFVPWKIFGSNGYKQQPESVIKSFTKRLNYDKNIHFQGVIIHNGLKYDFHKSITRTKYLINIDIHSHNTSSSNNITSDNVKVLKNEPCGFSKIDEQILQNSFLHLNHYVIQSYDWFMKIKATRGDARDPSIDTIRNEKYFKDFDRCCNDINDFELSNIA
jgi:hypothetical protein